MLYRFTTIFKMRKNNNNACLAYPRELRGRGVGRGPQKQRKEDSFCKPQPQKGLVYTS